MISLTCLYVVAAEAQEAADEQRKRKSNLWNAWLFVNRSRHCREVPRHTKPDERCVKFVLVIAHSSYHTNGFQFKPIYVS